MTTVPAITRLWPSMMPEAVRISVSIRSFSTEARDGSAAASSAGVAGRHAPFCANNKGQTKNNNRPLTRTHLNMCASRCRLLERFEREDHSPDRSSGRLSAVGNAQYTKQTIDVRLHGSLGNRQLRSDLFIASPLHNLLQDVGFARRQLLSSHSLREAFGNHGRDTGLARMNGSDGLNQIIRGHTL